MQLTLYTDYTLRVLVYLSLQPTKTVTISEIASFYAISRNHLVKVVHNLATLGYIHTTRGKGGGLRLAVDASQITIGEIVRKVEPNFDIVECFNAQHNKCVIEPLCALKTALRQANREFLAALDRHRLADAIKRDRTQPMAFLKLHAKAAK